MIRTKLRVSMLLPIITLAISAMVSADSLQVSLANPTQAALPGSIVSFVATVSAPVTNVAAVFLNSDSYTADYPLMVDDSGFYLNFPLSLAPGGKFTGELFTVAIPSFATSQMSYGGYFEIDGGASSNASSFLTSVNFQVTATPEPASLILLSTGLFGLVIVLRLASACRDERERDR